MTDQQLTWICHRCNSAVENREGCVYVDMEEVMRAQEARKGWDQQREGQDSFSLEDLENMPKRVPWNAVHYDCVKDLDDRNIYASEIHRLRRHAQVLDFVGHIAEKSWHPHTNLFKWARSAQGVTGSW